VALWDSVAAVVGRATRTGVGVAVTHTPVTGTASEVSARFDRAFVYPFAEQGVVDTRPTVWLLAEDLATAVSTGDAIVVNGTAYTVESIEPDGEGMSRCYLTED